MAGLRPVQGRERPVFEGARAAPRGNERHLPPREVDPNDPRYKSIPQGAATSCYVATSPDLDRVTGYYFVDCNPAVPNHHMQDDGMAARLWKVSEELVADYLA